MDNRGVKEAFEHLMRELIMVNTRLSELELAKADHNDADEYEDRAVNWAHKLNVALDDEDADSTVEDYEESVLRLQAVRNYSFKILNGDEPLGAAIEKQTRALRTTAEFDYLERSFADIAKDLSISKDDAADLVVYLEKTATHVAS
jgi:hypothetical protein